MGTMGSFPGAKVNGAWSCPLTFNYYQGQRMGVTIPPLPNTPSWRGTHFKKKSTGTKETNMELRIFQRSVTWSKFPFSSNQYKTPQEVPSFHIHSVILRFICLQYLQYLQIFQESVSNVCYVGVTEGRKLKST